MTRYNPVCKNAFRFTIKRIVRDSCKFREWIRNFNKPILRIVSIGRQAAVRIGQLDAVSIGVIGIGQRLSCRIDYARWAVIRIIRITLNFRLIV